MKIKKLSLMILIFFFVVAGKVAAGEIYIESKMATNVVCPSATILIEEIITTTTSDSFTVSLSGSAARFSTAIPTGFYLQKDERKSIFIYVTPSSKAVPGTYNLEVTITGKHASKKITHTIIVENCHKTVLEIYPQKEKICACESRNIELKLSNKGLYLEKYKLSVEGPAAQWVSLPGFEFTLSKNSSIIIPAQIRVPCDVKGNYSATFIVKSSSPLAEDSTSLLLEIVPCYDYIITTKNYQELCENERTAIPITIKNLGTTDNVYAINLRAPQWVSIERKVIEVKQGKEENLNLIAHPPFKKTGNFNVTVQVLSEKGKVLKETEILLNVIPCFGVILEIEKEKDSLCVGLNASYKIKIKNTGKFNNTFNINLVAPEWIKISENKVSLEKEEEKELYLIANPPKETKPADYRVKIAATDPVSEVESQVNFTIAIISMEDCYKPLVSLEKAEITLERDSTGVAAFTLENKGIRDAEYLIELSGSAASFCQVNPATIKVGAGKIETLYIYIAPPIEIEPGTYTLDITARLKDSNIVSSKTLKLVVSEEKVSANITNVTEKITGKTIEKVPNILEKLIDFFKKIFKEKPKKETNITNITNITNRPPILKKNIPDIKLKPGEIYSFNLSEYIEDPEKEPLFFTTIKPLNIEVGIIKEIVTIRAPEDFSGIREIKFYATDGENIIESNKVKIIVEATPEEENLTTSPTEKQPFFTKYKRYIIGAVVIFIILILIVSGLGKKILQFLEEEKPKQEKK